MRLGGVHSGFRLGQEPRKALVAWHGEDDAPGAQDGRHRKTCGPFQVLCGKEPCHSSGSVWPRGAEDKLMEMEP